MDEVLDPAIIEALPAGCEVVYVERHGTPSWANGYKVEVEVDGDEKAYFLKILQRDRHAEMARGEYESQLAMWKHIPDNVVVPVAHGTLKDDDSRSFYLALYRDFKDRVPEAAPLVDVLRTLQTSGISPNGKFGFHVPTFNGYVPLINDWCDTWEEWFARQLKSDIEWEQSIRGQDDEFNEIAGRFIEKVVPRLLRPLETGGRSINPVLIHGDLWHGNTDIDSVTNKVILFDACCCYGHSEMELFMMRETRYIFSNDHIAYYKKCVDASEPLADFDDRLTLYAMRDNLINSGLHEHRAYLRQTVKEDMLLLLEKYPNGIDDFVETSALPTHEDTEMKFEEVASTESSLLEEALTPHSEKPEPPSFDEESTSQPEKPKSPVSEEGAVCSPEKHEHPSLEIADTSQSKKPASPVLKEVAFDPEKLESLDLDEGPISRLEKDGSSELKEEAGADLEVAESFPLSGGDNSQFDTPEADSLEKEVVCQPEQAESPLSEDGSSFGSQGHDSPSKGEATICDSEMPSSSKADEMATQTSGESGSPLLERGSICHSEKLESTPTGFLVDQSQENIKTPLESSA